VIVWFAATAVVFVWAVFQSPALDYRLVAAGAVAPSVEGLFVGARVLHTLAFTAALLVVVLLATRGRRLASRRWVGLPIGTALHLVFDGAWARTDLFWWPFTGWSFDGQRAPEVTRGWWSLVLEVAGVAVAAWAWRRFGLDDPGRRERLWRTGQLDRSVVP
jgi:hypothetical protein